MTTRDKIVKLKRQLLPSGRAFQMPDGSYLQGLMRALANSEARAYEDSVAILNSLLPDNDAFTIQDATDWERRLGLVTNLLTPFADRKAAILRKMQQPGTQPAKAHFLYIQQQLQAAGFNVFVYENIIELYPDGYGGTFNPVTLNPAILSQSEHGDHEHGDVQSAYINQVIANSIDNKIDLAFNVGNSLRSTFFIGGNPLGTYANVLAVREIEFRQLVLSLKQVQDIGFMFVTYI